MRTTKVVGALFALLVAIPAGVASAETYGIDDPRDAAGEAGDISRVRVDNAPHNLFLRMRFHDGHYDRSRFYLDIVGSNPGPEYVVEVDLSYGPPAQPYLHRVHDGWWQDNVRSCRGLSAYATRTGNVNAVVPRRCLRIDGRWPGAVRIAGAEYDESGLGNVDRAPGRKRFAPRWVRHAS